VTTARARIRRRQLATITLVACVITPFFNLLTSEASLRQAVQGLVDAVLVSLTVGGYLLYVRDGWLRLWFRRLGFWTELVLSSTIVLTLFLVTRAAGQVLTTRMPRRFLASFTDAHLMVALPFFVVIAVTMTFILQMNRMLGINVLGYFAAGVYRRPERHATLRRRIPRRSPTRRRPSRCWASIVAWPAALSGERRMTSAPVPRPPGIAMRTASR